MLGLIRIVGSAVLGILLGLVVTVRILDKGDSSVVAGPWRGSPRVGTPEIDPYTLAANDRSSMLPLGSAEGLTFIAESDSTGARFAPDCEYAMRGPMPSARFWTVSLLTPDGFPVANKAQRYGFTSAEVLRDGDQPVSIAIAPEARAGNWLPTGHARSYVLMLRLYDTGLSTVGTSFDAAAMPTITRLSCQ